MRLDFITNIKTSMMLFVVFYHSCMFYTGHWANVLDVVGDERIIIFTHWLNSFHVPAFVMASGYLLYFLVVEKNHYLSGREFLSRKANRLLKPYILVTLLWAAPVHYLMLDSYSLWGFFHNFIMGGFPSQLWFLLMLFWLLVTGWFLLSHRMVHFYWWEWICCGIVFVWGGINVQIRQ